MCVCCRLSGCFLCVCACFAQKPVAECLASSCMLMHFQFAHSLLTDRKLPSFAKTACFSCIRHTLQYYYLLLYMSFTTKFTSFLACSFEAGILYNSSCDSTKPPHLNRHRQYCLHPARCFALPTEPLVRHKHNSTNPAFLS